MSLQRCNKSADQIKKEISSLLNESIIVHFSRRLSVDIFAELAELLTVA